MLQLAKMPGNAGAAELKRLREGGSLKETAAEKKERQRKAQLKAMPKGRGKSATDKEIVSKAKALEAKKAAFRKGNNTSPTQTSGPAARAKAVRKRQEGDRKRADIAKRKRTEKVETDAKKQKVVENEYAKSAGSDRVKRQTKRADEQRKASAKKRQDAAAKRAADAAKKKATEEAAAAAKKKAEAEAKKKAELEKKKKALAGAK
jgi:hypothetical protein